jgi:hypothetical protein
LLSWGYEGGFWTSKSLFLRVKSIKKAQSAVFFTLKLIFFCSVILTVLKSIYSCEICKLPSEPSPFSSNQNCFLKLSPSVYCDKNAAEPGLWYPILEFKDGFASTAIIGILIL